MELISDYDENGVPWKWHYVKERLDEDGVQALDILFDYYQEFNPYFDAWINYLLACSYFTDKELNFPTNRQTRKALKHRVEKIMKNVIDKDAMTMSQFLSQFRDDLQL
jgi:hypothetical protein